MADRAVVNGSRWCHRVVAIVALTAIVLIVPPMPAAHASLLHGLLSIAAGILEIPRATLAGTFGGPPIVGTLIGVLSGTFRGLGLVTGGALETAAAAAGLAVKAAPLIPLFL